METGDQDDIVARLRSGLLPSRWWPDGDAPVLVSLLNGLANPWAWIYSLLDYIKQQQRIQTATSIFLDLAAYDYLGSRIQRAPAQTDESFRKTIMVEVLRPRVTRGALSDAIKSLTGRTPTIFEPRRPADTGGYDVGGVGYGVAGGYGDLNMPFQALMTIYRPQSGGIAGVAGYDTSYGGYDGGRIMYADAAIVVGQVTDADILAVVRATAPEAVVLWVRITDSPINPALGA